MERKTDFIALTGAASLYCVSQLRIWQLIRQKKLRSRVDGMQRVIVDKGQLDAYMNKHRQELEIWQQPVKQEKDNESSSTKKSKFDYGKF